MSKSKASRTRELRRELRRPKRGRPKGWRKSLLDNPHRFRIALLRALSGLDMAGPYDLGALAIQIVDEGAPIKIEMIENVLAAVSSRYGIVTTTFDGAIDRLVRDARAFPDRELSNEDARWLDWSVGSPGTELEFAL